MRSNTTHHSLQLHFSTPASVLMNTPSTKYKDINIYKLIISNLSRSVFINLLPVVYITNNTTSSPIPSYCLHYLRFNTPQTYSSLAFRSFFPLFLFSRHLFLPHSSSFSHYLHFSAPHTYSFLPYSHSCRLSLLTFIPPYTVYTITLSSLAV